MEEEEREAQSAKLQELIRRGTAEDLREANQLMKVMAGYDTRSKVDYRAKAAEEVGKIQQKARLLEERLAQFQPGDKMLDGDVFSELASALSSAQPKIQKMCEEESDDHEAVAKLLEINDSIHRTFQRYKLLKKGDIEGANKLAQGQPIVPSTGATKKSAAAELSLIDFDDAAADTNGAGGAGQFSQAGGLEDDLLGLSVADTSSSYGQAGGIALGFGANTNIPGPALLSSITQNNSAKTNLSSSTSPAPGSLSNFSSFGSAPPSKSGTPQPSLRSTFSPPPQQQQQSSNDPFAALASISSSSSKPATPAPAAPAPAPAVQSNEDDEWNFSSALPPEVPSQPKEQKAVISNTSIKIELIANRTSDADPAINLLALFSNNTAQPITELHFQLAVTKGYELQLTPQSGRMLLPRQNQGVRQASKVWHLGSRDKKVEAIKLRWRVSYKINNEVRSEMGEIPEISVA